MRFVDRTGQRFGRLTALAVADVPKTFGSSSYVCRCDCGTEIVVVSGNLASGQTKSCGCLCIERTRAAKTKHGHSPKTGKSREYSSWAKMLQRCTNEREPNYRDYGGRGIRVCDQWRKFETFIHDMGPCPLGLTIDRIDNDGNYEPNNCRWASRTAQANNRRSSRLLTHNGVTNTISEWARSLGIKPSTIGMRLNARWSVEKALGGRNG